MKFDIGDERFPPVFVLKVVKRKEADSGVLLYGRPVRILNSTDPYLSLWMSVFNMDDNGPLELRPLGCLENFTRSDFALHQIADDKFLIVSDSGWKSLEFAILNRNGDLLNFWQYRQLDNEIALDPDGTACGRKFVYRVEGTCSDGDDVIVLLSKRERTAGPRPGYPEVLYSGYYAGRFTPVLLKVSLSDEAVVGKLLFDEDMEIPPYDIAAVNERILFLTADIASVQEAENAYRVNILDGLKPKTYVIPRGFSKVIQVEFDGNLKNIPAAWHFPELVPDEELEAVYSSPLIQ
jgi:hypothetical protein